MYLLPVGECVCVCVCVCEERARERSLSVRTSLSRSRSITIVRRRGDTEEPLLASRAINSYERLLLTFRPKREEKREREDGD